MVHDLKGDSIWIPVGVTCFIPICLMPNCVPDIVRILYYLMWFCNIPDIGHSIFTAEKNQSLQRLINFYKATQAMNDLAGIQILVPKPRLYSHE